MAETDLRAKAQEIKERCEKATAGPWTNGMRPSKPGMQGDEHMCAIWARDEVHTGLRVAETWHPHHVTAYVGFSQMDCINNAEFIAHAREDIPYLLSEIERLSAALAAVQQEERIELGLRLGKILGREYDGVPLEEIATELITLKLALRAPKAPRPEATRSASPQDSGWRPIETAPRDGRRILLGWRGLVTVGWYVPSDCPDNWDSCIGTAFPTHWMPLPAPPGGLVDHLQGEKI